MERHFNASTPINESILSAQSEDVNKIIEILKEDKQDLQDDAVKECFDVVIMAYEEKRAMQ